MDRPEQRRRRADSLVLASPFVGTLDPSKLRNIEVVWEAEDLLVVSKPAGMPVHGGEKSGTDLLRVLAEVAPHRYHLAHRIDRATSGLVALTKTAEQAGALQRDWHLADKVYLAWVLGAPPKRWENRNPVGTTGRKKPAQTDFIRVWLRPKTATEPASALVLARLRSGRMHQIRQHLQADGYPVLLDPRYGDFAANREWKRRYPGGPRKGLFLHHARLRLPPKWRPRHHLAAPIPRAWWSTFEAHGLTPDAFDERIDRSLGATLPEATET